MQTHDVIVPRLLSLKFHGFTDLDRRSLEKNIRGRDAAAMVSDAARCYLKFGLDHGTVDAGHLDNIAEWLAAHDIGTDVLTEFYDAIDRLREFSAPVERDIRQPRF